MFWVQRDFVLFSTCIYPGIFFVLLGTPMACSRRMRPPPACRLQGFLPQCFEQSYRRTFSRNHLLWYCLLHSRPSLDVRRATWYGSTAVQLLYAAAVYCCCSSHNTYVTHTTDQAAANAARPATESFRGPCLSSAQPNPYQLEQSVAGTRVQSISSARDAMHIIYMGSAARRGNMSFVWDELANGMCMS